MRSRTVIVDADDLDEATDKARSAYDSNEVILEADDFEKCEIIPASWTKNGIVPDGRDTKFFTHILGKTNTRIHYLYRDASNYKVSNEITVPGTFTEEQIDAIIGCLMDGEYFIPSDVTAIPQNVLYVLYTKYKSESVKLSATNRVLASDARRRKNMYWKELCRRKMEA